MKIHNIFDQLITTSETNEGSSVVDGIIGKNVSLLCFGDLNRFITLF